MKNFDLKRMPKPKRSLQAPHDHDNQIDWQLQIQEKSCYCRWLDAPINVSIEGSVGYYCGGMNKQANIHIFGSAGP